MKAKSLLSWFSSYRALGVHEAIVRVHIVLISVLRRVTLMMPINTLDRALLPHKFGRHANSCRVEDKSTNAILRSSEAFAMYGDGDDRDDYDRPLRAGILISRGETKA